MQSQFWFTFQPLLFTLPLHVLIAYRFSEFFFHRHRFFFEVKPRCCHSFFHSPFFSPLTFSVAKFSFPISHLTVVLFLFFLNVRFRFRQYSNFVWHWHFFLPTQKIETNSTLINKSIYKSIASIETNAFHTIQHTLLYIRK